MVVLKKPLEMLVDPNEEAACRAQFSDDVFWVALERYLENWSGRPKAGFSDHAIHIETITELILAHMK